MSKNFEKAAGGLYWSSIEKIAQFVLRFIITTVLARQIGPAAFGIVALVIIFEYFFLYLMDMGLNQVVIQKKNLSSEDINTAFTFNIILGIIFTFIFFSLAGPISVFFEENMLKSLIQLMSLKILIISFSRIHIALLDKNFAFKKYACISIPVRFFSGLIGIICIYQGLEIWSYIYYNLSQAILLSILMGLFSGYRVRLYFSIVSLKSMLTFGLQLSLNRIINTFSEKFYYLVIGKYYDSFTLGLFQRADVIRRSSSEEFSRMFNRVLFPLFSKAKDYSTELLHYHKNVFPFYAIFFSLMACALIGFSDELIFILLGDDWQESALYLKLLAVLGFFNCLNLYFVMIRKSAASGKQMLYETIFERSVRLGLLFASLKYGILAVIIGQIIGSAISFLVRSHFLRSFFSARAYSFIGSLILPLSILIFGCVGFLSLNSYGLDLPTILLLKLILVLILLLSTLCFIRIFYFDEFSFLRYNNTKKKV